MSNQHNIQAGESSDAQIASAVEAIFGLFGILGMGWLYAGNIGLSIAIFAGYAVLAFVEFWIALATLGIAGCIIFPLNITIIIVSSFKVRDYVRRTGAKGSITYLLAGLAIGAVVVCGGLALIAFAGGALDSY